MNPFFSKVLRLILGSGLLAGAIYLGTDAFGKTWREFVIRELAQRGLHLDFSKLRINPVGGIVAHDVRVFANGERKHVLADVDHLILDFNLGKLIEKQFVVEALELSHTHVSFPVNPEAAEPTRIELNDISARVFIHDGRLDLQQVEGTIAGIVLNLSGELLLPDKNAPVPPPPALPPPTAMQRVQGLREHQQRVQRGLDWLSRFTFAKAPRLNLEVNGSLDKLNELDVRLFFEAEGLEYGSYAAEEVRAEAEYNAGFVDLTRFHLKDRLGEVNVSASWLMGAEDLRFQLTSSADLPGLAQAFLDNDNLREIVFYESPHLALEGVWHVDGPLSEHKRPVQVTGHLDCGRFGTRGEVFDGLKANIGVAPEGVYVRDLVLRHKTGTVSAQTLIHETQGTRYQLTVRMDPNAFLPFVQGKQGREIIQRFQFTPDSTIDLEVLGMGTDPDPKTWVNKGHGDFRRFKYRGLYLDEFNSDVELQHPLLHFRNIKVRRPEGVAEAAHVEVNDVEKWVKLDGIKSGVDPVGVVGVFGPKTAEIVARYKLPNTTQASVQGTIWYRAPEKNDFVVKFHHPSGTGRYVLFNEDYLIRAPVGELTFKGLDLRFDVSGQALGGPMSAKGRVDLRPESDDFTALVTAAKFPFEVFKKEMPFEKVRADVSGGRSGTKFDIQSSLLGGSFSLQGTTASERDAKAYTGEMMLKNISLPLFAGIYWKGNDSQGDATGFFKFTGRMNDWQALKGTGALTILNGDLYSIPIVGMLAPMLRTILPKQIAGYNIAKEADCTFSVGDGFLVTKDFTALTSAFKILLDGSIDFLNDRLDMNAQVRVRGLPGIVFLPFSELLEYKGSGALSNPKWEAKLLRGGERTVKAQPLDENNKPLEQPSSGDGLKPLLPQLKKLFKNPDKPDKPNDGRLFRSPDKD
ncbi:MAG: AsmA-like C-terminal region-containing protein [Verrucomicrobiota bacterium]